MSMHKCPECGNELIYYYETECKIIFYCRYCDKKVMAWKG